jgi:hypothetical protein
MSAGYVQNEKGRNVRRKYRRHAIGGTLMVGVALMCMASVAFACTTYQGKMTVTANGASSVSQGDDNCNHTGGCGAPDGSMTFCSVSLAANLPASTGGTMTVSTGTTTTCTASGQQQNHLAASTTYDINLINANAMSSSDLTIDTTEDCMSWNGGSITKLTTASTDANGAFTKSGISVPAGTKNTNSYYAGICISDQGTTSNYGNEAGLQYT